MKSRSFRRAAALLLALALVCSFLTLPVAAEDEQKRPPLRIEISDDKLSFDLDDPDPVQLTCTLTPDNDKYDVRVTWSSSRPEVASVDENGLVTPKSVGKATIKVTSVANRDLEKTCEVDVYKLIHAEEIYLHEGFLELTEGDQADLPKVDIYPRDTTDDIVWESKNTDIIEIKNNKLVAKSSGRTTVRAFSKQTPDIYDECDIIVNAAPLVTGVTVKPSSLNLPQRGTATLEATVEGKSEGNKVKWASSSSLVSVSSTGKVTVSPNAPVGTQVSISAHAVDDPTKYAICVVTVTAPLAPLVSSVSITSPNTDDYRYVDPHSTMTLTAAAYPADASELDREITWSIDPADGSIATVGAKNGVVRGVSPGKATVTAQSSGSDPKSATREIEVSGILLSYIEKSSSGGQGKTIELTEKSVVDIYQYHDITASVKAFGAAQNKSITWTSSNNSVAQVVSGRVTANYPGEAVITAIVNGTGHTASFHVRVSEDVADAITVNMGSKSTYSFSGLLSELNSRSQSKTGAPLNSVYNLKVSTENGVLYYKYTSPSTPGHGVGGTERYYYQAVSSGQMALKDVTFVPLPGFGGTAVVDYNGQATSGVTFTGIIRIQAAASGDITYSTDGGQPVSFAAEHFSAICKGRTGHALGYVTFSQPSSTRGTLHYNYSPGGQYAAKVDSSTRYYASSKPSIDDITFVPASGYTGDVTIPYRCTDSSGATFSGNVTVTVSSASGSGSSTTGSRDVEYYTGLNQRQSLSGSDFNDACQWATGHDLNRIRFDSLPSSGAGTLYLDYTSSSSTLVTTSRNYYPSSTPRISSISFVPARNYSGTVSIPFTGYDSSGASFNGTLFIIVGNGSRIISYQTTPNGYVRFNAYDFNSACRRITGDTLDYVRFLRVSTNYGELYYQYNTSNRTGTSVTTGTNYYYSDSTRLIGNVSFAANSISGTTTFGYTGYSVQGETFSGTVEVTVSSSSGTSGASGSSGIMVYYTGSSAPIPFRASDFQSACQTVLGTTLSSIQFSTLPDAGRLYQNYSSSSRTGTAADVATRYSLQALDQISYVPQAEYQGAVTIPYTGYDTQGAMHSGVVEIYLSNSYSTTPFTDLAYGWDWAKPSIEYLRQSGITSGYRDNTFRPGQSISRGEFTLMICRAFQFPTTGRSGFPDVPAGSTYAGAVAAARELGIVQGDNGLFHPDQPITRQSAMTMICRALNAAGQTVPDADTSVLSSYGDGAQVSAFARSSVAALIQMGAVRGNSAMRLNPGAPISRAEMAVILHRVLAR